MKVVNSPESITTRWHHWFEDYMDAEACLTWTGAEDRLLFRFGEMP